MTPERKDIARTAAQVNCAFMLSELTEGADHEVIRPAAEGVLTIVERVLVLALGEEKARAFLQSRVDALVQGSAEFQLAMIEFDALIKRGGRHKEVR